MTYGDGPIEPLRRDTPASRLPLPASFAGSISGQVSGREPSLGRPSARTLQVPGPSHGARSSNVVLYYDEEPPPPNAPSFRSESPPMGQVSGISMLLMTTWRCQVSLEHPTCTGSRHLVLVFPSLSSKALYPNPRVMPVSLMESYEWAWAYMSPNGFLP